MDLFQKFFKKCIVLFMLLSLGYTCAPKGSPIKVRNESPASLSSKLKDKITRNEGKTNTSNTQSVSSPAKVEPHAHTIERLEDSAGRRSKREKFKEGIRKVSPHKRKAN